MLHTTQFVRQSHASKSRPASQGLEKHAMLLYLHDQIGDKAKVPPYSLLEAPRLRGTQLSRMCVSLQGATAVEPRKHELWVLRMLTTSRSE